MAKIILDDAQVKEVNEIYHDLEAQYYVQRHPEIYVDEKSAWEQIGQTFLKSDKQLTILDIGTGTGFVPMLVSGYLKENDKIICTDLSEKMLKITQEHLASLNKIKKEFIKADALEISKMDLKVDCITMNSVLHHIPDYPQVLSGLGKHVTKGGLFIIMHERNKLHSQNRSFILFVYQNLVKVRMVLKRIARNILIFLGMFRKRLGPGKDFNQKVYWAVKEKKLVGQDLTIKDINAIVDIHDPDEKGEGFDPFKLHERFFPDFKIISVNTYKHLGAWVNESSNGINKFFSRKIKNNSPYGGALFSLIMKKN
ncbi:MAG: class I SAM-dependent methyltransferase [Candidatus Omnitrophota bacterium]|jgi:ubiquinone/menaquinone biosynthesis C-methylase UbiE